MPAVMLESQRSASDDARNVLPATTIRDVAVDDEFRALCPPLADEEREQLLANVMRDGFRDPVTAWSTGHILLDGHNRRDIWQQVFADDEAARQPAVRELVFDSRERAQEWVIRNQFGRRNLTAMQRAELALKREVAHGVLHCFIHSGGSTAAAGDRKAVALTIGSTPVTVSYLLTDVNCLWILFACSFGWKQELWRAIEGRGNAGK